MPGKPQQRYGLETTHMEVRSDWIEILQYVCVCVHGLKTTRMGIRSDQITRTPTQAAKAEKKAAAKAQKAAKAAKVCSGSGLE